MLAFVYTLGHDSLSTPPTPISHNFRPIGEQFLFAFGTCSRDQAASRYCLNLSTLQWVEWAGVDDNGQPTAEPYLHANLSTALLGFRGLVCAVNSGHLPPHSVDGTEQKDGQPSASSGIPVDEAPTSANPELLLLGRPDFHMRVFTGFSHGIWMHHPRLTRHHHQQPPAQKNTAMSAMSFHPDKPMFSVPPKVVNRFIQHPSPVAMRMVNWDQLCHAGKIFRFHVTQRDDDSSTNLLPLPPASTVPSRSLTAVHLISPPNHFSSCFSYSAQCDSD